MKIKEKEEITTRFKINKTIEDDAKEENEIHEENVNKFAEFKLK